MPKTWLPLPPGPGRPEGLTILCSYHVSQQNTQTGRLTEAMLDAVLDRALEISRTG